MELCIDIGNTTIEYGFYSDNQLVFKNHLKTDLGMDENDFITYMVKYCRDNKIVFDNVKDIIYSSVVPEIDDAIFPTIKKLFPYSKVITISRDMKFSFSIDVAPNEEIGSDLLACLEGVAHKYGYPCVVFDLGTATKALLLDKNGRFFSCLILTGIDASAEFLYSKTSKLPCIDLSAPKSLLESNNTVDAMRSGIVYGHAESVMGLARRYDNELGYKTKHIITGGQSKLVGGYLDNSFDIDYNLVLDGLHHLLIVNKGE